MGASVAARDVTKRKRAERLFQLAVESAPNAMVMINCEGKIVLANRQAETLFGYGREELMDQPVELLAPLRFRERHPELRRGFLSDPRARPMGVGGDLYALRKDGSEVPVEIGLNPIETDEGTWVLSAIVDITERKRAQEERTRLLGRERAARGGRAGESAQGPVSRRRVARAAHARPLYWVGRCAPQSGELDDAKRTRALEIIEHNANTQTKLLNDLLDVSRVAAGKLLLEMRPVRIRPSSKPPSRASGLERSPSGFSSRRMSTAVSGMSAAILERLDKSFATCLRMRSSSLPKAAAWKYVSMVGREWRRSRSATQARGSRLIFCRTSSSLSAKRMLQLPAATAALGWG